MMSADRIYDLQRDGIVLLCAVEPLDGFTLRLPWDDGASRDVDMNDWLKGHPLLEALREATEFAKVSLIERGDGLVWPNGADFCAQALRIKADEQYGAAHAAE